MKTLSVLIGSERFDAVLNEEGTPRTCEFFRSLLPWDEKIIHVRWSGEACWIPLGDMATDVGFESATSHPRPGEFLLYPGGISETEIVLAYGPSCFASRAGQLAGNPFLKIESGLDRLAQIGRETLWQGAKEIRFIEPAQIAAAV